QRALADAARRGAGVVLLRAVVRAHLQQVLDRRIGRGESSIAVEEVAGVDAAGRRAAQELAEELLRVGPVDARAGGAGLRHPARPTDADEVGGIRAGRALVLETEADALEVH